jgi:molecular chaperone GrpE
VTDSPETVEQETLSDDHQGPGNGNGNGNGNGPGADRGQGQGSAASQGAADLVAGAPYETPEEMAARIKELTGDLQRLQAEYVNYKRRVDRDRDLVLQNAKFSILSALLPVLDDVDRAREHGDLVGPFATVAESLTAVTGKLGLVAFGEKGDPFDPTRHEAVTHQTSTDVTESTCVEVMRRGYTLGERLLRPALVAVADPE